MLKLEVEVTFLQDKDKRMQIKVVTATILESLSTYNIRILRDRKVYFNYKDACPLCMSFSFLYSKYTRGNYFVDSTFTNQIKVSITQNFVIFFQFFETHKDLHVI